MTRVMLVVAAVVMVLAAGARAGEESTRSWWADHGYSCEHCRAEAAARYGAQDAAPRSRSGTFDEATGRDTLNYPPHRFVDTKSMVLEVAIRDMQTPVFAGRVTLAVVPIGRAVSELRLDAGPPESMAIGEVSLVRAPGAAEEKINFSRERDSIVLRFDPALAADASGEPATISIPYVVSDPPDGLHWTPESPAWPGRPAQIHSQGQAQSNHHWFPCHDFPNERLATELVVTVPSGFVVSSNGRLVERNAGWASWTGRGGFLSPDGGTLEVKPWESAEVPQTGAPRAWEPAPGTSYETFHWKLDRAHVNYLVSLIVGKFDVVDVGGRVPAVGKQAGARRLELPVYTPPGLGGRAKQTYGRTLEMMEVFERLLDEPYPWGERYAQLVVHNFGAGGMENTGATTMYDSAIFDKTALLDGDLDGLISHELAHQWFGNLITCNSWEHIWLNEGWATYMTALWFEHRDGRDAYHASLWGQHRGLAARDKVDAPYQPAMASKAYENPWETFRRAANPYSKGASVLAMLRAKLGDDVFFKGVALYVDRFKDNTARTADFRRALEDASGLSLQRFFDQWVLRPGVPKVTVASAYDEPTRALTLTLTQTQAIDGWNPAFELDVPMVVALADGSTTRPRVKFDTREASVTIGGVAPARWLNVDPGLTQLVDYDVVQGAAAWSAVLGADGPLGGRLRAAAALAKVSPGTSQASEAAAALSAVLRDRRAYWGLRAACADALGDLGRAEELMVELERGVAEARVRRAVVSAIASASKPEDHPRDSAAHAADTLAALVGKDESYGVRAAAVRSIGSLKAERHMPIVMAALQTESQHDQIRVAALETLADLDKAEGFEAALAFTRPGAAARTRPAAVRTVAALAKHHPDRAFETLAALLNDSEDRTARTAGDALVTLKDPRGVATLEEFARTQRTRGNAGLAASAERWLKSLREKLSGA